MPRVDLPSIVNIDYGAVERLLSDFLRYELQSAGAKGFVVGLSGGLDSSVTYALAVKAVGRDRVLALIMPEASSTPPEDVADAMSVVSLFGGRSIVVDITPIYSAFLSAIPDKTGDRVALGNLKARIRMAVLYYYANTYNMLVLGTSDRSELLIGYFTKYGDGASDVAPLAVLYKSQVRRFALHLGLPERIAFKPSAPRLWPGHLAEEELKMRYEDIDLALFALVDLGLGVEEAAAATGLSHEVVRRVAEMYRRSEHKRRGFKTPPVDVVRDMMLKNIRR